MPESTIAVCILALAAITASAQTPAPVTPSSAEAAQFNAAAEALEFGQYSSALAAFKQLIASYPANQAYKKFAAEAALDSGDAAFALADLTPVEAAHPDDWQVHLLLARAYQATAKEPGHPEKRDEEIETVSKMHESGDHPRLAKMRDFLLETVHQGGKTIQFYPAFVPWGPYKVSLIARISTTEEPAPANARVTKAKSSPGLRITLESGDADQPNFAIQHPAAAAAGEREYTLDGYAPEQKMANGQTFQTHYTYAFFTGKPSYDVVRENILAIAAAKASPLSGRTGPVD